MGSADWSTDNVRERRRRLVLGDINLLRGALTFLIDWEIKNEESHIRKEVLKEDAAETHKKRQQQ